MDEAQKVAYYDKHRGEPQEITDVVQSSGQRKRDALTVTVAVRFSAPEAEALSNLARREGTTYSEIIRTAVQRYAAPELVINDTSRAVILNYNPHGTVTQAPTASEPQFTVETNTASETRSSVATR